MNIYGEDESVNLASAIGELKRSGAITTESRRRAVVIEIQTAALLDIANSLRVLAAEALSAMPADDEPAQDEPAQDERDRDFLIEGDFVRADGLEDLGRVASFGVSEGATYASVEWTEHPDGRAWLDQLTRVLPASVTLEDGSAPATGDDEIPILEPTEASEDDEEGDPEDDFEPSALDVLKAAETKAKKSKKGSKK